MSGSSGKFDGGQLGARIKLLRELRDMSLQAVADAAGLTKSHVWEMEQGKSVNPTVNAVWGLSEALSVSPAMLLGLDDKLPPPYAQSPQRWRMIVGDLVERLRTVKLLSQRNQMALQAEAADEIARLREALGVADAAQFATEYVRNLAVRG